MLIAVQQGRKVADKAKDTFDKIMDILKEYGYQIDSDEARQILLTLTIGSYKVKAVQLHLTNDQIGKLVIAEVDMSLKSHFGNIHSREIIEAIFISIAKLL
jgi:hypothetical protein